MPGFTTFSTLQLPLVFLGISPLQLAGWISRSVAGRIIPVTQNDLELPLATVCTWSRRLEVVYRGAKSGQGIVKKT